jgi:dihydrofolate reductase
MRKLVVTTMLSLDGVMQAPGGPEEDPSDGFAFGGWTAPFVDDEGLEAKAAELSMPFDLLLGRRTYEIFAGYWPNDPGSAIGKPLNDATKYVATRSRPSLDWGPSVLIEDAAESVAALKQEDGPELQVHGRANLAQTLIRHGLVDEYHLWVSPSCSDRESDSSTTARSPRPCDSSTRRPPRPACSWAPTSPQARSSRARSSGAFDQRGNRFGGRAWTRLS